ncbi:MAG: hypothetical protein ACI39U_05165 [Candidatus Cryptobacteroides sp.]
MKIEKRLFLEDILARTDAIMAQCAELKALVSSFLETEEDEDLPPAEPVVDASPADPAEVGDIPVDDIPADDIPAVDTPAVEIPDPIEIEDSFIPIFEKASQSKTTVMVDKLASKEAWRTDIPGARVSDIRSAISLNDRILFINTLFGEDPAAFKDALSALNSMSDFEAAVSYVTSSHPEWDMESDTVYRFMMAVRRRLQ